MPEHACEWEIDGEVCGRPARTLWWHDYGLLARWLCGIHARGALVRGWRDVTHWETEKQP